MALLPKHEAGDLLRQRPLQHAEQVTRVVGIGDHVEILV